MGAFRRLSNSLKMDKHDMAFELRLFKSEVPTLKRLIAKSPKGSAQRNHYEEMLSETLHDMDVLKERLSA